MYVLLLTVHCGGIIGNVNLCYGAISGATYQAAKEALRSERGEAGWLETLIEGSHKHHPSFAAGLVGRRPVQTRQRYGAIVGDTLENQIEAPYTAKVYRIT